MSSSYTFFKPLDLSRFNGQKNILINANILIKILLIIFYLLYFISISKSKKSVIFDSLYLSLRFSLHLFLLYHCSTFMDRLQAEEGKKKKNKNKQRNTEIERNTHLFLSISQAVTVENMRVTVCKLENFMVHSTNFSNFNSKTEGCLKSVITSSLTLQCILLTSIYLFSFWVKVHWLWHYYFGFFF